MTETPPDESGRQERGDRSWLPHGAIIFFVVVLVVVVAVALARPGWFGRDDDDADSTSGTAFAQTLAALGQPQGISLGDDNSTSTSFTVAVPRDADLHETDLTLVGRTQAAEDSTVYLRVLVDGTAQYVAQLDGGDHDLDVEVPVPADAMEDGSVQIQVRLTGTADQARCTFDTDLGALVVIDAAQTRLHGQLSESLHTVRDLVAGLAHDVTLDLALPSEGADAQAWFETASQLGVALTQAGHDVSFADVSDAVSDADGSHVLVGPAAAVAELGWSASEDQDGSIQAGEVDAVPYLAVVEPGADVVPTFLESAAVTTADTATTSPSSLRRESIDEDPVSLASLGATTDVQQLTTSRSWRVAYSLADLPGGSVPTALRLAFQVPAASDDTRWIVQVRLNDQLVGSPVLGGSGEQRVDLRLPSDQERLRNQITVTLLRDRDLGGCHVKQTTYDVQLLPDSALELGGAGAGLAGIPASFADGFDLDLPSTSLADPAATLTALVPTLAEFSGWQQAPDVLWDGAPGTRAFLAFGPVPQGVTAPVTLEDGRLTGAGFDLQAPADGLVVQRAQANGATGLVVTAVGDPTDAVVPPYGRERARVIATVGGGFVVSGSGQVVSEPAVRAEPTS